MAASYHRPDARVASADERGPGHGAAASARASPARDAGPTRQDRRRRAGPAPRVDGEPHLLYIRRAHDLPHHRGQIAFPGGRHQPEDDPTLEATALREASEEIGLAPRRRPSPRRARRHRDDGARASSSRPFVGVVPYPYAWRPCPREVDAIFTVPLGALRRPARSAWRPGTSEGRRVPITTFPVDGHVIWGATQRITRNLLDVLAGDDGGN